MSKQKSGSFENLYVSETHRIIYTEISSIKKRIHLLEGERKANFQLNDEQLKRNETRIQQLRQQNQKLKKERVEMAKVKDTYFELIGNFLGSKRKAYEYKGKDYEGIKDILDCKIGDVQNKINLLVFKKNKMHLEIRKVVTKEHKLLKLSTENDANKNGKTDEIQTIENKISEMKIKVTETENLQIRYKNMSSTLTTANLFKTAQLSQMENEILQQSKESGRLTKTLSVALKVKKESRARLVEMEEETLGEYGKREESLFAARIKLKEIHEKMEAIGAKLTYPKFHMIHRDSSLTDGLLVRFDGTRIRMSDEMKSQNVIEKVFNQLQEMTGESDPIRIVQRYQQQREHSKELSVQLEEATSILRKCKLRKRFLEDKLRNLQYSGGQERQILDEQYLVIKGLFDATGKKRTDAVENISYYQQLMEEVFVKLNGVCLMIDIDVSDAEMLGTSEKVIEILKLLYSQIEEMIQTREIAFATPMISPVEKEFGSEHESYNSNTGSVGMMSNYFFGSGKADELSRLSDMRKLSDYESNANYLISPNLQLQRSSVNLTEEGNAAAAISPTIKSIGKKSDSSDDEDAVGRNYIKKQSQVLVEAKTRKGRFNVAISMAARPRNF